MTGQKQSYWNVFAQAIIGLIIGVLGFAPRPISNNVIIFSVVWTVFCLFFAWVSTDEKAHKLKKYYVHYIVAILIGVLGYLFLR